MCSMGVVLGVTKRVPEGKVDSVVGTQDLVMTVVMERAGETEEGRETFEPRDGVATMFDDTDGEEASRGEEETGNMDRKKKSSQRGEELDNSFDGVEGHGRER